MHQPRDVVLINTNLIILYYLAYPRGTSPSRPGKKVKVKTAMRWTNGKRESKRGEAASVLRPNWGLRPKKGRGRPIS